MSLITKNLKISIAKKNLINDLSCEFNPGEVWGILGCNGSGKTTLLHTLAGLHPAIAGGIMLKQKALTIYSPKQRTKEIALLLQHNDNQLTSKVIENVLTSRYPHRDFGKQQIKKIY